MPPESLPVVIVGAGASGLAAAAMLKARGIGAIVLDASGEPGGAFARLYPGMRLLSPWPMNRLPLDRALAARPARTAAEYAAYLRAYASLHGIAPRKAIVRTVRGQDEGPFQVETDGGPLEARCLVAAAGEHAYPVMPALSSGRVAPPKSERGLDPSEPRRRQDPTPPDTVGTTPSSLLQLHAGSFRDPAPFAGKRVLIVGSGISAFELGHWLLGIAARIDLSVRRLRRPVNYAPLGFDLHYALRPLEWLSRYGWKAGCHWSPPPGDKAISPEIGAGRIRVFGPPARVEGSEIEFEDGRREGFDAILWATGYEHRTPFLPAEVSPSKRTVRRCASRIWPGLFFLGYPCVRSSASAFLRGIAEDAPLVARGIERRIRR